MSYFDDASLVMIPSGYKDQKVYSVKPLDGSGDLTFSRASSATRVASNGLIEKVRTNLALSSNNISTQSTYWTANQSGVTTQNSAAAPDGTTTAALITPDGVSTYSGVRQSQTFSAVPQTYSVYLKTNSGTASVNLLVVDSASSFFGLTPVTVTTTWTRFTVTFTPAAGAGNIYITSSGSTAWLAWGAQLETSDIATNLIATTSAAVSVGPVSGLPRLDYLNSTCPRLLLEPQRSNLITYSEQFNNSDWTKNGVTITANATTSPDGYTNADKIVAAASSGNKVTFQVATVSSGVAYTASAYYKASEYNYAFMRLGGITNSPYIIYNLSTQALVASAVITSSSITSVGNGWYRITATATADSGVLAPNLMVIPSTGYTLDALNVPEFTGNGTSGGFVWGCQVEAGAYATSYIPTLGTSVTRVADAASKTGISSLIGQTEGTLFVDLTEVNDLDFPEISIDDNTNNNRIVLTRTAVNGFWGIFTASAGTGVSGYGTTAGNSGKLALAYSAAGYVLYRNGVQVATVSAALPVSLSAIRLNGRATSDFFGTKKVAQALLFKTRLTNAQLAELTTL